MCALKRNDYRIREKLQNIKDILAAIEHYRINSKSSSLSSSSPNKNGKTQLRQKLNNNNNNKNLPLNPNLMGLEEQIKSLQLSDKHSKRLRRLMDAYYKVLINTIHSFKSKSSKSVAESQDSARKSPPLLPGRPLKLISMEKQTPMITRCNLERLETRSNARKLSDKHKEPKGRSHAQASLISPILDVNPMRRVDGKPSVVYSRHIVSKCRPSNRNNQSGMGLFMEHNNGLPVSIPICSTTPRDKPLRKSAGKDMSQICTDLFRLPDGHREAGGANKKPVRRLKSTKTSKRNATSTLTKEGEKSSVSVYINNYTTSPEDAVKDNAAKTTTPKGEKLRHKSKLKKKSARKGHEEAINIQTTVNTAEAQRFKGGAVDVAGELMNATSVIEDDGNRTTSPMKRRRSRRTRATSAKEHLPEILNATAVELKSESAKLSKQNVNHQSIYEEVVKEERDYVALMDKYRVKSDKMEDDYSHADQVSNSKCAQTGTNQTKRVKTEYIPFQSSPDTVLKHILAVRVPNAEPQFIENIPIKYPFVSYDKQSEQSHVARQIRMAIAKGGGRDIAKNKYLRSIIQRALCENVSWSFIDKFLGRHSYRKAPDYDIHLLQIDLNGVVFILCTVQTNNLSALISALEGILKMCSAKWKSVVRHFHHCSVIEAIAPYKIGKLSKAKIRELLQRDASDLFVADIELIDDMSSEVAVKCDPHQVSLLVRELRCKDYEILNADYGFWPKRKITPKPRESYYYKKLLQHLLELDDVVTIIDNVSY